MENNAPISTETLLKEFDPKTIIKARKIVFEGMGTKDVYNVTAPFTNAGKKYIAARVESRESEHDSQIVFFIEHNGKWVRDHPAPAFDLQDPAIATVNGKIVLSGVKIFFEGHGLPSHYKNVFLEGTTIHDLHEFASGPIGMKDIRIKELDNGNIGVFTRPQGKTGGRGRIGFVELPSFKDFKELPDEDYYHAPLLALNILESEWIGANEIHQLSNGLLGVLGHIACFSPDGEKKYFPCVFAFDPTNNVVFPMKIIARREDAPTGFAKRNELRNVLFPGGLVRNVDGTATLYTGAGDAEAYEITMADPFIEYENLVI